MEERESGMGKRENDRKASPRTENYVLTLTWA